jgi:glycosyltransferase involved in cell wall biosynthesis
MSKASLSKEATRMKHNLVTIGVPVYNGSSSLRVALESLRNQKYDNIEILISDNCSTDATPDICQEFVALDKRFCWYRQAVNVGPTENYKFVLAKATGDFFMWLAHDDWIETNYVETCLNDLIESPQIAFVAGKAEFFSKTSPIPYRLSYSYIQKRSVERILGYFWTVTHNSIFYGLFRTASLKRIKLANLYGNDWIIIGSMLSAGYGVIDRNTVIHRKAGGISRSHRHIHSTLRLPFKSRMSTEFGLVRNALKSIASKMFWQNERSLYIRLLCASAVAIILVFRLVMLPTFAPFVIRVLPRRLINRNDRGT